MRLARDETGRRYVVLERASESTLVADPASGEREYFPNETLEVIDDAPARTAERLVGLIAEHGPIGVRELLSATDICESDLHGQLADLEAGGAIREVTVAGERGYALPAQS